MAIFKCKMCGGDLNITADEKIIECEFCGTTQTIPTSKDENLHGLFNRANILRMKSEFDKAEQLYEKIIEKDETQAEAYWGLILCKYGIEYVEDPETLKRIPTCHRTSFDSIIADEDYKSALSYADSVQRGIYEAEAKEIDRLQKEILELSQKEEPYDVFICYKETDNDGKRTQDSVIANDIYHQLTQEGLKVFYAAITLENKLGSAYEPCIFAALNSAKVMLAIGTKPEHFNAVWVKNEWSRFLKIIQKDRSKLLIPCYRDMDAYELPEEFAHLQAQDMSKIGFINDIVRGIKKVVTPEEPKQTVVKETVTVGANSNTAPLLERVFMFLEDGDWNSANEYCEKVLDIEPKCAEAYLGKLMAELHVKKQNALKNIEKPFNDNNNYQKAIRFGSEKLKSELQGYIEFINERNEEERLKTAYAKAINQMNTATTEEEFKASSVAFDSIKNYKDAKELAEECLKKAEIAKKDKLYNKCMEIFNGDAPSTIKNWEAAMLGFNKLEDYKDSKQKAVKCAEMIEQLKEKAEQERIEKAKKEEQARLEREKQAEEEKARKEQERIEKEKQEQANREEKERIAKRNKKIATIVIPIIVVMIAFVIILNTIIIPINDYNKAISAEQNGEHMKALTIFMRLDDFNDSKKHVNDILSSNREILNKMMSAGLYHSVALKMDGTVIAVGENGEGQCNVSEWNNIIAVSAGNYHTVGLRADGTVVATTCTKDYANYNQCNVSDWKDINAISAGHLHTVGLNANGTVVAVGENREGQCNVSNWSDIVSISAGNTHTVGLNSDGTVVAVGANYNGECDVFDWKDIISISAGGGHTVGLRANGTVVAIGNNEYGQCNVQEWKDIVAISTGTFDTVGLKSDGTVVITRNNKHENFDFSNWTDILATARGNYHSIGLKKDGTVVAEGANNKGECDVQNWNLFK